jgi:hypothetical protein
LSRDDMTAQYLLDISLRLISIPYAVRIDDQGRTVLTDIQTARMVYPDPADPHRHAQATHVIAECSASFAGATAAPMGCGTLIDAAEHVNAIKR